MYNHSSNLNMNWLAVRQLNPLIHKIICDPKNCRIHTFSSLFHLVLWLFLLNVIFTLRNPIIFLCSIDFTEKFQALCSAIYSKTLKWFVNQKISFVTKCNSCPLKHSNEILNISDITIFSISCHQKLFGFFDKSQCVSVGELVSLFINLIVCFCVI